MGVKNRKAEPLTQLSRRERQIMDIVYSRGKVTSEEVLKAMIDAPSYSAVRALMRILADKGLLKHRRVGMRYVFEPVITAGKVRMSALVRLVHSLFDNSAATVMATLLSSDELKISPEELKQLKTLINEKEAKARRAKN
jgi:BlaI family transcriptional regulator, penicillinase repressor